MTPCAYLTLESSDTRSVDTVSLDFKARAPAWWSCTAQTNTCPGSHAPPLASTELFMPRADEKLGGYTMRKGRDLFIFSRIMSGFVRGAVLAELQPQETIFLVVVY